MAPPAPDVDEGEIQSKEGCGQPRQQEGRDLRPRECAYAELASTHTRCSVLLRVGLAEPHLGGVACLGGADQRLANERSDHPDSADSSTRTHCVGRALLQPPVPPFAARVVAEYPKLAHAEGAVLKHESAAGPGRCHQLSRSHFLPECPCSSKALRGCGTRYVHSCQEDEQQAQRPLGHLPRASRHSLRPAVSAPSSSSQAYGQLIPRAIILTVVQNELLCANSSGTGCYSLRHCVTRRLLSTADTCPTFVRS